MKAKSFLFFSISIFAISFFLILFNYQQSDTFQTIVSNTHNQLRSFQNNLKEVEEYHLLDDDKYLKVLGLGYPSVENWHNTSKPVIVTYASDSQHAQAIGFVRNIAAKLPDYSIIVYNIGLSDTSHEHLATYCNSSKCMILNFDLSVFPSHVKDDKLGAWRPLIIQHALSRVGGIIFLECDLRYNSTLAKIQHLYTTATKGSGIISWPSRTAVSSLTHPRMFDYFHTTADGFLFLPMVKVVPLIIVRTNDITEKIMKPWVQCALTHDCIFPIGAQSGGCKFDKKPQYRYSGCHSYDESALNIVLGLTHNFDESFYTYRGTGVLFRTVTPNMAALELNLLEKNSTTTITDVIDNTNSGYKNEDPSQDSHDSHT